MRSRFVDSLHSLRGDVVEFIDNDGSLLLADDLRASGNRMRSSLIVNSDNLYSRLATDGALGFAESYIRGEWSTTDLTSLLRILYRNSSQHRISTAISRLSLLIQRVLRYFDENTLQGSRRHIAAHYDLSNEFFESFLDPTLMYSSAYFEKPDMSLHEASIAKLDRICQKLHLEPGHKVLEIGTGWGGFTLHCAKNHDVQITTTTISSAQAKKARERFTSAGLNDRVTLLEEDYRNLDGRYDRLVSIEMVEAVGERYLDEYFQRCGRLLKPGGRFVLQGIVMPEQRYESYRRNVDFIQAYIFPGGFLPSVTAMQQAVGCHTDLRLVGIEDLSSHYARTLSEWRSRFLAKLPKIRELGFDDRFIRMWEYYLCYCEAAFREQAVRVVQIVWDKPTD
ncbi:MAG: class I SAM-dependent methyltransferase [Planctomycetales bacterium]|nr:class I SAM-dependent methyltransferase [Planctomycetales bacterium]